MTEQSPTQASLTNKLEAFAAGLNDDERGLLGRLLIHAVDAEPNADDVQGYSLFGGTTPLLFQSLQGARSFEASLIKLGQVRQGSVGVLLGAAGRGL